LLIEKVNLKNKKVSEKWKSEIDFQGVKPSKVMEFHEIDEMMQEHLSTSASQPANHASEFKSNAKREAQPHLNLN
jgi:hypothetical protein